jgi:hypothetical protein
VCERGKSDILFGEKGEEGWDIPAQKSQARYCHGSNEIYHLLFMER